MVVTKEEELILAEKLGEISHCEEWMIKFKDRAGKNYADSEDDIAEWYRDLAHEFSIARDELRHQHDKMQKACEKDEQDGSV